MKKIFLLAGIFALLNLSSLKAQVTVGIDKEPVSGALLQLKGSEVTGDAPNSIKGLAYPRVNLTNISELYPMFGTTGAETGGYGTNKAALKASHTGLTVYNMNTNSPFIEGIYVWNGDKWDCIAAVAIIQSIEIPIGKRITDQYGLLFYGEMRYSGADLEDYRLLNLVPAVSSYTGHDFGFAAENLVYSISLRRDPSDPGRVIWKLRVTNSNYEQNKWIDIDHIRIHYSAMEIGKMTPTPTAGVGSPLYIEKGFNPDGSYN